MAGVCHLLKNSKSAIKLLQMVLASPRMPKREFLRLNPPKHTTHELQRTAGTTPPSVTPWEFAGVVWEFACYSEKPDGPMTPPKRRSAAGTALGAQLVVT
jgi:hypothetical protein